MSRQRGVSSTDRGPRAEARAEHGWLAAGSSSVQQPALRDFGLALAALFTGTHRKPSWRKAGRDEGFCVRDVNVRRLNRRWGAARVPKVGELRFRLSTAASPRGLADGGGLT